MKIKDSLKLLVLETVSRMPTHGYAIAQHIKSKSEGLLEYKEGTLYPVLHGLEADGLLESYTVMEKNRERRFYKLTQKGTTHLEQSRQEWNAYVGAMGKVLGGVL